MTIRVSVVWMLFRRRKKADLYERLRLWLWPRRSFARSVSYISKRILRLSATPHAIAAGFAAGVFASFTPYIGLHIVITVVICYLVAGNVVSGLLGTLVGNPLTAPLIWASTYGSGYWLLKGQTPKGEAPTFLLDRLFHLDMGVLWDALIALWEPVLKPMTLGAFVVGIPVSLLFYFSVRWATIEFQERRRKHLADRATKRREKARLDLVGTIVAGE